MVSSWLNKNPGAECAKEVGIVRCTLVADLETDLGRVDVRHLNNKMTLDNGYLGSCIDEERSEMRYLV